MTFQRKLLLGFMLMVLPLLLVGAEAIRSNALERDALEALGQSLSRSRTYADAENAMFEQSEVIWRALSGLDPTARREYELQGEVVENRLQRWEAQLEPAEQDLARGVRAIQQQFRQLGERVFELADSGRREEAYVLALTELKQGLQPALAQMNREVYRRARESSVQQAFTRLAQIIEAEQRIQLWIILAALAAGLLASWLISRSLARPINELRRAMAVVGAGDLDHPIEARSHDEIGDLARAFARMTANLRESRASLVRVNDELAAKVAQLERTQAQLVQSEKLASIGEMSAAVAHGLRNPLASLRAAAQLVRRHPTAPGAAEHLDDIIAEVDRLDRRITHLLAFARPAPFHPQRESLAPLIENLLGGLRELLRERRAELRVEVEPRLPEVRVDPIQLEQALIEIVSNALDAMPDGGRLTIAARRDGTDGVAVTVTDTGAGIPDEALSAVCEPFFTTRPEGTGLGLAIAKRYVEQHGGRLEIRSRRGEGTTVVIRLPTADEADVAAAATAARSAG